LLLLRLTIGRRVRLYPLPRLHTPYHAPGTEPPLYYRRRVPREIHPSADALLAAIRRNAGRLPRMTCENT